MRLLLLIGFVFFNAYCFDDIKISLLLVNIKSHLKEFKIQTEKDISVIKAAVYFKVHSLHSKDIVVTSKSTFTGSILRHDEKNKKLIHVIKKFLTPGSTSKIISFFNKADKLIAIAKISQDVSAFHYGSQRLDKSVKMEAYKAEITQNKYGRVINFYNINGNYICGHIYNVYGLEALTLTPEFKKRIEEEFNIDLKKIAKVTYNDKNKDYLQDTCMLHDVII